MITNRKFELVPARKLRFSQILPRRSCYDDDILESMKKAGVQQPLIVRPLPDIPGEYEIIDGSMRYWAFNPDDLVLVDVRYGIEDSEVFKISDISFKRKQRITFERSEFLASWVKVESREHGKRGAQARIAEEARLTESEISQYLAIHRMFTKLEDLIGPASETFNALKNHGINKLYEISRLMETPIFLKAAGQLAKNPNMPVRELRCTVEEETSHEKMVQHLINEDPFEADDHARESAEIAKLAQEMLSMTENTRESLEHFETRMKQTPEGISKDEILKELRKLQRRLKRLQKGIVKLPDLVAA